MHVTLNQLLFHFTLVFVFLQVALSRQTQGIAKYKWLVGKVCPQGVYNFPDALTHKLSLCFACFSLLCILNARKSQLATK